MANAACIASQRKGALLHSKRPEQGNFPAEQGILRAAMLLRFMAHRKAKRDFPAACGRRLSAPHRRRDPISRCLCLALLLLVSLPSLPLHAAGDVAAGRRKALQCQTCHGLDGLSKLPEAPHLAGQPEPYLVKSLNDYRTGVRRHDMMTIVVQPLTDQDVADLAAYYAAIEITARPPQ